MNKIKAINKRGYKTLSDEEIYLFRIIHIIYETEKVEYSNWNDAKIKQVLQDEGLTEHHNTRKKPYIIEPCICNNINMKVYEGVSRSFIRHLRNAIVHYHIEKDSATGNIHTQDWQRLYTRSNKNHTSKNRKSKRYKMICTMDANISFESLKKLLNLLIRSPKLEKYIHRNFPVYRQTVLGI